MAKKTGPVLERIVAMSGYQPGEQPRDGSLVKLNTNENPYPPSPRALEAARGALEAGLNLYPDPTSEGLREAASARYGVPVSGVVVGNGSDDILSMALRACAGSAGRVAYSTPTYSLYATLSAVVGAETLEVAWPGQVSDGDGGSGVPAELQAAAKRADVTFVCSPNSPSGRAVSVDAIEALANASSGLVVADEAYIDFGGHSALEVLDQHDNLLVTRSLSKSFSLAGLRLGLGFASPALIESLAKTKDSYNVSAVAAAAGVAALEDYDWMLSNADRIITTRRQVTADLVERGYRVPESRTNFFWLDWGVGGGRRVFEHLKSAGVLVRYFDTDALADGVRVSVGTDEQMERFMAALAA